jgi:hypothetical protein
MSGTSPPLNGTANGDATAMAEGGLLVQSISAEIVSELAIATERERFIQQVRDRVTA